MRHHRQPPTERAVLLASRTARPSLTLAIYLCVAGYPAR